MAKEGYVQQKKRNGIGSWIGWGITTLLLFFLNRNSNGSDTSSQQPTEFKEDNVNCIGQPVPVVLGRSLIKNPLISYYGDFGYEPYTEEYGMHSGIDVWGFLLPLLLSLLNALMQPDRVNIPGGGEPSIADKIVREAQKTGEKTAKTAAEAAGASAVPTGTIPPVISKPNVATIETLPNGHPLHNHEVTGYIEFNSTGQKAWSVAGFVISVILWLLSMLFGSHLGRTTIQKGFLYYLGWQHIICWTGRNIGIGDIYMNEYLLEPEPQMVEESIKVYEDMGVNLHSSLVISTALYNTNNIGGEINAIPFMQFGGYHVYYDINRYATSSDINRLKTLYEYADNESDLINYVKNAKVKDTYCDSCIIVLQGVGISAFSRDFYSEVIKTGKPLVIWQLDRLNLKSDFDDAEFIRAHSTYYDTKEDSDMVKWLCNHDRVYVIDGRDFALNYLSMGYEGTNGIAQKYKTDSLRGVYYIDGGSTNKFINTPVQCPLSTTWTLIHFIQLAHIDYDYPLHVWKNNSGVHWEKDHMTGHSYYEDDKELFGGWDEEGGFTGELRFYFGNRTQPKDPWMIHSMNQDTIEESLRGLTPQYPMYVTCVVSNKDKNGGAYIGKQATIPEMWFEIFNYPSRLGDYNTVALLEKFCESLEKEYKKADDYIKAQDGEVQGYMESHMNAIKEGIDSYLDSAKAYIELPRWKGKTKYDVGMIAMFNDIIYKCVENHESTVFSADLASGYWKEESNDLKPWKPNTKFNEDDMILRQGLIYKCTKTFTTGNSFTERNLELQKTSNQYPSIDYLHNVYKEIEETIEYFPPTNRKLFAETLEGLSKLCLNGVWHLGRLGDDANPAEAIYEILVNSYWGCDYLEDKIDISSLIDVGVKCEEEGLGVSCLINRTAQSNEYILKILNHINGVKYDDPTTGKLTFKLIRNDYEVDKLKVFDTTNTESCEFSRLDWSETTSAVDVTFTDASNKYDTGQFTFNDISNRLITGFYTSKSVEGEYFTTTENAMWLAKLTQLSNGYPLSAVNLITNRYAYDVTIGDPIKVTWQPYGLSQVIYRITDIDYANLTDGKISITAIEDVFGFDKLDFDVSESPQWTDPTDKPGQISRYTFMEEPYETSRSLDSYIFAYAAQPDNNTVYWDVYRKVNGGFIKSVQSMLWSTIGRLTFGCLKEFTIDDVGMEFSILGTGGRELMDAKIEKMEKYPTTYTNVSGLNLVVIDDEWMSYDSIDKLANGHYKIRGVIRGIFDTIPEQHTAESIMYFVEDKLNIVQVGRPVSLEGEEPVTEELEIVSETRNAQQPFDSSRVQTFTTTRRSEQPSIMANMKFGIDMGELTDYEYDYVDGTIFSGDLLYTFIGRNKYDDYGIVEQTNADVAITVANDTMNVIQMYSNGVESEWKTNARDTDAGENVNSMSLKWEQFCEKMGDNLRYKNDVNMKVMTYNSTKDLYSYAHYEETIDWYTPRFVGVVGSEAEAQELANSYMSDEDYHIIVPETSVSLKFGLTFSENPIIIEGTIVTGNTSINDIVGQDGNPYRLSNTAYRIIGKDEEGNAILNPFTIENNYVLRTDFTEKAVNKDKYYKYSGNNWIPFEIYNE